MEWLQVVGFPKYYVNSKYEVKGPRGMMKTPIISLRRKGGKSVTIKPKRLYLLTAKGFDPYVAKGHGVDTVEIEGSLRLMDHRERTSRKATMEHERRRLTSVQSKQRFTLTIEWAQACIEAIGGDTKMLWDVLERVAPHIDAYLRFQCGEKSEIVRQEVVSETIATYVERVLGGRTTTCNTRALKRMARGNLAKLRKDNAHVRIE